MHSHPISIVRRILRWALYGFFGLLLAALALFFAADRGLLPSQFSDAFDVFAGDGDCG